MALSSINLRIGAQKASTAFPDRAERLRRNRAAAQPLREIFPAASRVTVQLQFRSDANPSHADQSFELYPGARAYFGFPCPYGDCNGIYDLGAAALSSLERSDFRAVGTLECSGTRSRHRQLGQACGLQVSYTVTAEHAEVALTIDPLPGAVMTTDSRFTKGALDA